MEPKDFLDSAALLLVVAAAAVALFRHFGLGSILGLLVAGVLIGPFTPGPTVAGQVESLRHFTELGVVLLLFVIGLEMHPRRLWDMRRTLFGLGSLQVLLTGLLLALYFRLFVGGWFVAGLIGLSLALSSTALVLQLLYEQGEVATEHGQTAFSVLLMQDLAVVPMLALMPLAAAGTPLPAGSPFLFQLGLVILMVALTIATGRWLVPWVLDRLARQRNREAFLLVVMATVFVAAWAMEFAGMSMALGAFLMGMLLSGSHYSVQIQASIEPHKGLLMSLFFVAVGMSVDVGAVLADVPRFLLHLLVLIAVKLAVVYLLCRRFGRGRQATVKVAFLLAQAGEFGFILFGAAKGLGILDDATFVTLVALISVSMLLTPLLAGLGARIAARLPEDAEAVDASLYYPTGNDREGPAEGAPRVVIAGYGRVGHTIGAVLAAHGIRYIAFEANAELVARWQNEGYPVFYGDIRDPNLLVAARVEQAETVVLTIDNQQACIEATNLIRAHSANVRIIARARDLIACDALYRAGASNALPEAVEASLRLAEATLAGLGISAESAEALVADVRGADYALVRAGLDAVPSVPEAPKP